MVNTKPQLNQQIYLCMMAILKCNANCALCSHIYAGPSTKTVWTCNGVTKAVNT